MTANWTSLDTELARWAEAGLTLPLWWRDDDAVRPTAALDRLAALSAKLGLPVHLAVIPAQATPELAAYCAANPQLVPVVHGWAHQNNAPAGEKKAEFGAPRPAQTTLADARQGLETLQALFGNALRPMFVPPWNRIGQDTVQGLAGLGYSALSTFKPREAAGAAPGLIQINTHLDPIAWKTTRSLVPPQELILQVARQLADRREGRADNGEPYGILTHHLVHDAAIWHFTEALAARLLAGPARAWVFDERTGDEPT